MAESPWLTASASRTDFDSGGSITALHSIYGSQVSQLPLSSSQVSITRYDEEDDDGWPLVTQSRSHTSILQYRRPISAPVKKPFSRLNRPPSAAVYNNTTSKQKRINRPTTALPSSRNTTVVSGSYTRQYSNGRRAAISRPNTAQPLKGVRSSVARPSTARPLSYTTTVMAGPGLLQYNSPDEEKSKIKQKTTPVSLSNVPHYFNFWNEKPIRPREWGIATHERRPRKTRPKSDYGIRRDSLRNRLAEDSNNKRKGEGDEIELGTLYEVIDGSISSSGEENEKGGKKRRRKKGGKEGEEDSSEETTLNDDNNTILSGNNINENSGTGFDDDDKDKTILDSDESYRNLLDLTDLGEGKDDNKFLQLGGDNNKDNDADKDDYFTKIKDNGSKGKQTSKSLSNLDSYGAIASAAMSTRFELPMDLKTLEVMSPSEYLSKYCIISQRRMCHYTKIFTKFKYKDFNSTNSITNKEYILQAIVEVHFEYVTKEEVNDILQIAEISINQPIDIQLFGALCALTERRYCSLRPGFGHKELIEKVDFEALDWRLRNCVISDSLKTLFQLL